MCERCLELKVIEMDRIISSTFVILSILLFSCDISPRITHFKYSAETNEISFDSFYLRNGQMLCLDIWYGDSLMNKEPIVFSQRDIKGDKYLIKALDMNRMNFLSIKEYSSTDILSYLCFEWSKNGSCFLKYVFYIEDNLTNTKTVLLNKALEIPIIDLDNISFVQFNELYKNRKELVCEVIEPFYPFKFYNWKIFVKSFLFDKNIILDEQAKTVMAKLIRYYYCAGRIEYSIVDILINKLPFLSVKLSTTYKASYYYAIVLSASVIDNNNNFDFSYEEEIKKFIKHEYLSGYSNASIGDGKNLKLKIYKANQHRNNTLQYLLLLCVNSDNTYRYDLLGYRFVDDIAPEVNSLDFSQAKIISSLGFDFLENGVIRIVERDECELQLRSFVNLSCGNFSGHNPHTVPLILTWTGDLKEVIIEGENYKNYIYKVPNIKRINVEELTSPYHFNMDLILNTGDNYIPVKYIDKRGNVTESLLSISTEAI